MDKEIVREAYQTAIDDGYKHSAVSKATGIGESSLKNFYYDDGGFSAANVEKLHPWLSLRGFMPGDFGRRDPFAGIIIALRALADRLEVEAPTNVREKILLGFLDRIDDDPTVARLKNSDKTSDK